jgi:hypothetical protein
MYLEGREVRTDGSGGYVEWQSGARVTAGTEKPKTFATLSLVGSLSRDKQRVYYV